MTEAEARQSREEFGARVRALRTLKGWAMEQLAASLEKSPASISRIEKGKQNVAVGDIKAIAKVLEVSTSTLLEESRQADGDIVVLKLKAAVAQCVRQGRGALLELDDALQNLEAMSV